MTQLQQLIRRKFGTETALAEKLGWTRQKLNRITGGAMMPNIAVAWELSQAMGEEIDVVCRLIEEAYNERRRK